MMLRKRSRSTQKDQHMGHLMPDSISESYLQSDFLGQKQKTSSFFNIPGLFVGFNSKVSESDSVRSPTSPLDFRVFSNLGNPFWSPRSSSHEGNQKSWDCHKVGLSIIDSLEDYDAKQSGQILRSSDSKNILFGSQMRIKRPSFCSHIDSCDTPKSLPKNYAIFPHTRMKASNLQRENANVRFGIEENVVKPEHFGKILSCSLDTASSVSRLTNLAKRGTESNSGNFGSRNGTNLVSSAQFIDGSPNVGNLSAGKLNPITSPVTSTTQDLIGSLSASEIKLSEDYTCIRTYGPNPKTTHIFGDCVLECHESKLANSSNTKQEKIGFASPMKIECSETMTPYPSSVFLSFCFSCKKKLDGEDIYMYRGEKAFCSWGCRSQEILIEEATEKTSSSSVENSSESNDDGELSETTMFVAT